MNTIKTFSTNETRFLSNFFPYKNPKGDMYPYKVKVFYNGLEFKCVECAYMASKTKDLELQKEIQQMTPFEAKALSEAGGIPLREDWEDVKIAIMSDLVEQKFSNNNELKKMLLDTGDSKLEEGNTWKDVFWGIDLSTKEGENHLGKITMKVRKKLRDSDNKPCL